jgi:hypothetical protein
MFVALPVDATKPARLRRLRRHLLDGSFFMGEKCDSLALSASSPSWGLTLIRVNRSSDIRRRLAYLDKPRPGHIDDLRAADP